MEYMGWTIGRITPSCHRVVKKTGDQSKHDAEQTLRKPQMKHVNKDKRKSAEANRKQNYSNQHIGYAYDEWAQQLHLSG